MSARQEAAQALLRDASKRMVEAEYAEAEALARLGNVPHDASMAQIDEWIAEANLAHALRVQSQVHYANCRMELRLAWEEARGGK